MIQRPPLTEEQKQKYETELKAIIAAASPEIQKEWDKNPHITWLCDQPHFQQQLMGKVGPKLANRYLNLENKRKGRNI